MPTSAFKWDLDDGAPSKITQGGRAEFSTHLLPYHEDTTSCFLPLGICRTLLLIITSELMSSSYFLLQKNALLDKQPAEFMSYQTKFKCKKQEASTWKLEFQALGGKQWAGEIKMQWKWWGTDLTSFLPTLPLEHVSHHDRSSHAARFYFGNCICSCENPYKNKSEEQTIVSPPSLIARSFT